MKTFLIGAFAASLISTGAFAHSSKETTVPADGETVSAVNEVVLSFDKPMRITQITLSAGNGDVGLQSAQGMDPVKRYVAEPQAELSPGDYAVEWRGLSSDGHMMQGGFSFTISP